MKLIFYAENPAQIDLRPNPPTREWMNKTAESYAYRCLPLNIANAHGWSFHLPFEVMVMWNGQDHTHAMQFRTTGGNRVADVCMSNFGHGIVTFFVKGVFRTEPGWDMYISGAANAPIDGAAPLQGVAETDWSPYSFTMNWQITRVGHWVRFPKGYPFCSIFPVPHGYLQEVEPEIRPMASNLALKKEHDEWSASRRKFIDDLGDPQSRAVKDKWQKSYYQGKRPDGSDGPDDHLIKLRLNEFVYTDPSDKPKDKP